MLHYTRFIFLALQYLGSAPKLELKLQFVFKHGHGRQRCFAAQSLVLLAYKCNKGCHEQSCSLQDTRMNYLLLPLAEKLICCALARFVSRDSSESNINHVSRCGMKKCVLFVAKNDVFELTKILFAAQLLGNSNFPGKFVNLNHCYGGNFLILGLLL